MSSVDARLKNPERYDASRCTQCSNCNPNLTLITLHYTFIIEDMKKPAPQGLLGPQDAAKVSVDLLVWQSVQWEAGWKDWPGYAQESLVSSLDICNILQRALSISTVDHLDAVASIPHLYKLGPLLLAASRASLTKHTIHPAPDTIHPQSIKVAVPETLQWTKPTDPASIQADEAAEEY